MHWIALPLLHSKGDGFASQIIGSAATSTHWWALRFTPHATVWENRTLLLEVSTTERIWGGRSGLLKEVLAAWAQAMTCDGASIEKSPSPVWGCGSTALIAQAVLQIGLTGRSLPKRIPQDLPLNTLPGSEPDIETLEHMGCYTWGALQAMPRASVIRRFGSSLLRTLDQALGHLPHVHRWLELPEQFFLTVELAALAESADALLWSTSRCLTVLQDWLQARQQGALRIELLWHHDLRRVDGLPIPSTGALQVGTAQPTQDVMHLRRLLSELLARTQLSAPVRQITLRLLESAPAPHRSASLLSLHEGKDEDALSAGEALHQMLERLSARLGAEQVQSSILHGDHRPERMQRWQPAAKVIDTNATQPDPTGSHAPDAVLWPTWLLDKPLQLSMENHRPYYHGVLRLLSGPHRLETGWWSGGNSIADEASPPYQDRALRDYFVAHNNGIGLVWILRERFVPAPKDSQDSIGEPYWFLHGFFG